MRLVLFACFFCLYLTSGQTQPSVPTRLILEPHLFAKDQAVFCYQVPLACYIRILMNPFSKTLSMLNARSIGKVQLSVAFTLLPFVSISGAFLLLPYSKLSKLKRANMHTTRLPFSTSPALETRRSRARRIGLILKRCSVSGLTSGPLCRRVNLCSAYSPLWVLETDRAINSAGQSLE